MMDAPALEGTYRLVSSTRTLIESGEVEETWGAHPTGFIMYGKDNRLMVLMVRGGRPKASFSTMSDEQRIALFDSMAAYSGTYTFDGTNVTHTIDASWNEVLTGTTQVRTVRRDGNRLIYMTGPGPSPNDGKLSINTLTWEKIE
jgi:hypothetical protein